MKYTHTHNLVCSPSREVYFILVIDGYIQHAVKNEEEQICSSKHENPIKACVHNFVSNRIAIPNSSIRG